MKVVTTEKLPIKLWLPGDEELDEATMQQAKNLANLPVARFWVGVMPDCHLGYGMPIGGVLATEKAVVPNAVGVDIGCGMIAIHLDGLCALQMTKEVLQTWRVETHKRVPVGMASHKKGVELPIRLRDAVTNTFFDRSVSYTKRELIERQLGTLGGGNHFIELQADEHENVWLMLHSGSRGLGKAICDHYHKLAKEDMLRYHTDLPDLDLAFIPEANENYTKYLLEMHFAMTFAEENREAMLRATCEAIEVAMGYSYVPTRAGGVSVATHHNFARLEHHFGKNVIVHRKGAVHAKGLVTIPGSMGTASYIGEGLQNKESFETCSHGAGRVLGRKAANKIITREQAEASMEGVVFGIRDGDFDEMPAAYKDIDAVMLAQEELVKPVYRLRPLAVVKG